MNRSLVSLQTQEGLATIIVSDSARLLKGFIAKTFLGDHARAMVFNMALAFVGHRGRMSCSAAAGSVASEAIHRGQLTRFLALEAVQAWAEIAITSVLFLEHMRAKRFADRRLAKKTRQWWRAQRLHGLCTAFRQECKAQELKYLSDRLKTSGGVAKLKRLLTAALPAEYRAAG